MALGSAARLPWAWLGFGSALQALLLGILFTVPFHHLWSIMPEPQAAAGTPAAAGSWEQALAVAVYLSNFGGRALRLAHLPRRERHGSRDDRAGHWLIRLASSTGSRRTRLPVT